MIQPALLPTTNTRTRSRSCLFCGPEKQTTAFLCTIESRNGNHFAAHRAEQRLLVCGVQRALVPDRAQQPDGAVCENTRCECNGAGDHCRDDAVAGDFSNSGGELC